MPGVPFLVVPLTAAGDLSFVAASGMEGRPGIIFFVDEARLGDPSPGIIFFADEARLGDSNPGIILLGVNTSFFSTGAFCFTAGADLAAGRLGGEGLATDRSPFRFTAF